MKSVIFFGTFDPLHTGHRKAFFEAKTLGDYLIVVVARDNVILEQKKRPPRQHENERLAQVAAQPLVDEAVLGDASPSSYNLLKTISFDVLAVGYDQAASLEEVTSLLVQSGKGHVRIVRLQPFAPERYKSSLLRTS